MAPGSQPTGTRSSSAAIPRRRRATQLSRRAPRGDLRPMGPLPLGCGRGCRAGADRADRAAGYSYEHRTSGPGSPASLYLRRELQGALPTGPPDLGRAKHAAAASGFTPPVGPDLSLRVLGRPARSIPATLSRRPGSSPAQPPEPPSLCSRWQRELAGWTGGLGGSGCMLAAPRRSSSGRARRLLRTAPAIWVRDRQAGRVGWQMTVPRCLPGCRP